MPQAGRNVVFVDGVRTPFGKSGPKGLYAETRADDLVVRVIRELMRRNPDLPPERIDEVAVAATTQIGDQGLTLGRTAALLAGLPKSVPGYSVDRMCAGAMTATTTVASGIGVGAYDVALAAGVEHMGRHPMGEGVDPNPRFLAEKIVDPEALLMGKTAENLHDRFPQLTKERADAYAVASQEKTAKAYADGKIQPDLVPVALRSAEHGWGLATADEPPRPGTSMESLAGLKVLHPEIEGFSVTAGNSSGTNDAAAVVALAAPDTQQPVLASILSWAQVGVAPKRTGSGPIYAIPKALDLAGLKISDVALFEINEAFAAQAVACTRQLGLDEEIVNVYGSGISLGHPIAATGARMVTSAIHELRRRGGGIGVLSMCAGGGMGAAMVIEVG